MKLAKISFIVITFSLAGYAQEIRPQETQAVPIAAQEEGSAAAAPAARKGDMTSHGGTITTGCATVLIGGLLAARAGDMTVCPMVTPLIPPIPHVGGPILTGSGLRRDRALSPACGSG